MASDDDAVRDARELFQEDMNADRQNRDAAQRDLKFYAGGEYQWTDADLAQRKEDGRPRLTINQLPQYVHQVVNDARIKPPSIGVRPVDDGADRKIAEIYTGLVRNIEQQSFADIAYMKALEHAAICGMGHWRVTTEYASDDSWDLDIRIRPIFSPFSVVWDSGSQMPTREDARHVFVTEMLTKREFQRRWPKARTEAWDRGDSISASWFGDGGEKLRVAEYWYKDDVDRTLLRLTNGKVICAEDEEEAKPGTLEYLRTAGLVERERKVLRTKVCMRLMSGAEQLEDTTDWAGTILPIVPVLGEEIDLGEWTMRRGMVRDATDPQKIYNLHRSTLAEAVAMAPKAKWTATPKQLAGHEPVWANANRANYPVLYYNPDGNNPPPQRVAPDVPSQALIADLAMAADDLQRTTGIYRASLGDESNEKTGKAIIARQREGDVGTYHYVDNLGRGIMQTGRILVELIPLIYDTERVVRTLGEDGAEEIVTVNKFAAPGQPRLNDLAVGKYDVVVTVAPSYSTRREESRESMMAMTQAYPGLMQIAPDVIVKQMDWPGSDEIAARARRSLPPGLATPEEGDPPPQPQPPAPEQVIAQAEMIKAQAMAEKAQAEVEIKRAELGLKAMEARQAGVKIEDEGNAKAVGAHVKLFNAAKPQPAPQGH